MRLGCGCLLLSLVALGGMAALGWAGFQILQQPDDAVLAATTRDDAVRAQEKVYAILNPARRRGGGTVILTEAELNAFLARTLVDIAELPLSDLSVRLPRDGVAEIRGRLPLSYVAAELHGRALAGVLPRSWAERRVWIRLRANVSVEPSPGARRYLRLDVSRFSVGRQPLPSLAPRLLLDPSALRWLRSPLPASVEDVRVETGRVVVRAAG